MCSRMQLCIESWLPAGSVHAVILVMHARPNTDRLLSSHRLLNLQGVSSPTPLAEGQGLSKLPSEKGTIAAVHGQPTARPPQSPFAVSSFAMLFD